MGDAYFNIDHGYLEGLVRGFKSGIIRDSDYQNLVECQTLEGEHEHFKFKFLNVETHNNNTNTTVTLTHDTHYIAKHKLNIPTNI